MAGVADRVAEPGGGSADGLRAPAAPSLLAQLLQRGDAARLFCGMGVCLECETEVDGRVVRACLEPGA